jgi:hypothetical protein
MKPTGALYAWKSPVTPKDCNGALPTSWLVIDSTQSFTGMMPYGSYASYMNST